MYNKKELRKKLKEKRTLAFAAHINHAQDLIEIFPFEIAKNTIIAGFYPFGDEINILPLLKYLEENGEKICLPRINIINDEIDFHAFKFGDLLELSKFGICEPSIEKEILNPLLVLVPLLGFNKYGYRIGYGKGYYDKAIKKLRLNQNVKFIGIAFKEQEVENLPIENHDEKLDYIITPEGLYPISNQPK